MTDKKQLTDLYVSMYGCPEHPQTVLLRLGIKYQHSTPQSMGDMWQFWNCLDVPDELPDYIQRKNYNPNEWIGYGLGKDDAENIITMRRNFEMNKNFKLLNNEW